MRELISETQIDGFTVKLYAMPEDMSPDDCFDDDGETTRAIAAGEYAWFVACVTASKAGVELGADYLGGCCYETPAEFLESLYFDDMAQRAIEDAREKLAELAAA